MIAYDVSRLKRNPAVVSKLFKTSNNVTTVSDDVIVTIPTRYIEAGLATIDNVVKTIGIYAVIDSKNNYAVCNTPIYHDLSPFSIEDTSIGDVKYKILNFHKGSVFMPNTKGIVNADVLYPIFKDLFAGGRVPWFMDYEDLCSVFVESKKYINNKLGSSTLAFEIVTSVSARDASNLTKYYRLTNMKNKPKYVGLDNKYYSYNNTGAKLIGSYMKTGMMTSLLDPETKTSETSKILRS